MLCPGAGGVGEKREKGKEREERFLPKLRSLFPGFGTPTALSPSSLLPLLIARIPRAVLFLLSVCAFYVSEDVSDRRREILYNVERVRESERERERERDRERGGAGKKEGKSTRDGEMGRGVETGRERESHKGARRNRKKKQAKK